MKTYTVAQFLEYVNDQIPSYLIEHDELNIGSMKAILNISVRLINDEQRGIEADTERAKADARAK